MTGDDFFDHRKASSHFKHDVFGGSIGAFAAKTGSTSLDHRVSILDCYAGAGRYLDGSPGSPTIAARVALGLAPKRSVRCFYVERNPAHFRALEKNMSGFGHNWKAYQGSIEDRVDEVLADIGDDPMYVFADPFGAGMPFDLLATRFLSRPTHGGSLVTRKTEMLMYFPHIAIARMAGRLTGKASTVQQLNAKTGTLVRVDSFLGGPWWRDIWMQDRPDRIAEILRRYAELLSWSVSGSAPWYIWPVPVAKLWGSPPSYYLIYATQSPHGLWAFNESLSRSLERFYDRTRQQEELVVGQMGLFSERQMREAVESAWAGRIQRNVLSLLDDIGDFTVLDHVIDFYKDTIGMARSPQARSALKNLRDEGAIETLPRTGDIWKMKIVDRRRGPKGSTPKPPRPPIVSPEPAKKRVIWQPLPFEI